MKHNGFVYKNNGGIHKNNVRYLICKTKYCKGSAKMLENRTIVELEKHTHDPDEQDHNHDILKKTFGQILKDRSKHETTRLRTIYDEEMIRNATAATLYPWPVAEISMRKARRRVQPVLPSSLNELANFLDFNVQRYTCCQQPFFQDKVTDTHGKCSIIFACSTLIRKVVMCGSNELHADATFKVVPSTPPSRQLFIMHSIYQNHSIPIVYALMESKTEEAYTLLLRKCKELFPFLVPVNIMTDFESGLLNAFKSVYPDADQNSCWFHYVQALVKNIRTRGLTRFVKSNLNAQRCVQMFCALALLPSNKIDEGYTVIRQYARDNNIFMDMAPFFSYFSRYWLNNQNGGDYLFSVHGIARRTNNNIESFHGRLKEKFQVMNPNLWTFLTHLNELSKKSHIIIDQFEQGHSVTRPIKVKYIANSQRISIASSQLDLGILNVNEFLLQCCHTTDRYLREELSWQINILGEVTLESDNNEHEAINIPQLDNSTSTDNNVTNEYIPNNIVSNDATEDDGETFVIDFHNISNYSNDSDRSSHIILDQQQQEQLVLQDNENDYVIPEDLDPTEIEYGEIIAEEREEERQNLPYVHYNRDEPLQALQTNHQTCIICNQKNTHVIVPCGHKVLCGSEECLAGIQNNCPICAVPFILIMRVYD